MNATEQAIRWARMRARNASSERVAQDFATFASMLEDQVKDQYLVPWLIRRAPYVALGAVIAVMVMR